ncbi:hypothetical protein [Sphingomonas psychrotolerans]|uniref:hypothetical protein n=1 Tax=Sphingomonas psychrotolerans TaxID=1327635 RepID=UPI00130510CA|nr:hypothetical protein [Sphingomonas psychrotolerans]
MGWCGYIDLLGSRDAARHSSQSLLESLDSFHSAIIDAFDEFDGDCYAFSDGAFFSCADYELALPFIRKMRNQMFQDGKFFRCSFLPGDIGVNIREKKKTAKFFGKLISYTFLGKAPEAYQRELNFKGVGCTIDTNVIRFSDIEENLRTASPGPSREELINKLNAEKDRLRIFRSENVVKSFFIDINGKNISAHPIEDFKYTPFEISSYDDDIQQTCQGEIRIFDQIVSACYSALARSSKVSSYYISAFSSIIRSLDLRDADWNGDSKSWVDTPYAFRELMSEGSTKLLREVPGFHFILLSCFDQLYRAKEGNIPSRQESAIVARLMRVPLCFRNLDRIPDIVISVPAKNRLVELKLMTARAPRPTRPAGKG